MFSEHCRIILNHITIDLNMYLNFIIIMSQHDYDNEIQRSIVSL